MCQPNSIWNHHRRRDCTRCGWIWTSQHSCPARGMKCYNCGHLGHYARKCLYSSTYSTAAKVHSFVPQRPNGPSLGRHTQAEYRIHGPRQVHNVPLTQKPNQTKAKIQHKKRKKKSKAQMRRDHERMCKFLDNKQVHAELPFICTTEKEFHKAVKQNSVATRPCLKSPDEVISMSEYINLKTECEKLNQELKEQEAHHASLMRDFTKTSSARMFEYCKETEALKYEVEKLKEENSRLLTQIARPAEQKIHEFRDKRFQNSQNTQRNYSQPHQNRYQTQKYW